VEGIEEYIAPLDDDDSSRVELEGHASMYGEEEEEEEVEEYNEDGNEERYVNEEKYGNEEKYTSNDHFEQFEYTETQLLNAIECDSVAVADVDYDANFAEEGEDKGFECTETLQAADEENGLLLVKVEADSESRTVYLDEVVEDSLRTIYKNDTMVVSDPNDTSSLGGRVNGDSGRSSGASRQGPKKGVARLKGVKVIHMCNVCGKVFKTSPEYADHYRSHTGEKPVIITLGFLLSSYCAFVVLLYSVVDSLMK